MGTQSKQRTTIEISAQRNCPNPNLLSSASLSIQLSRSTRLFGEIGGSPNSSVQVWSWRVYSDLTSSRMDSSMLLPISILFLDERILCLFEHRFGVYGDPFGKGYIVIAHVCSTCLRVFKDAKTGPGRRSLYVQAGAAECGCPDACPLPLRIPLPAFCMPHMTAPAMPQPVPQPATLVHPPAEGQRFLAR